MSLLAHLLNPQAASGMMRPGSSWFGWGNTRRSAAGVYVNEQVAMTYSAVWSATRLLAETVAQLPAMLFERNGDRRERLPEHPVSMLLHHEPNPEMDAFTFWDQEANWLVNWGNAYAEIERNSLDEIVSLWPIHPSRVPKERIFRDRETGEVVFTVLNEGAEPTPIKASEMLHVPGPLSDDGITGKGTLQQAREAIGLGIAAERYGARVFGNSAIPPLAIKVAHNPDEKQRENFRREWHQTYGGENQQKTAILGGGADVIRLSFPPEEAQALETRKFTVNDVARWYRVPPHMLGDLDRATFSNIESQGIEFVTYSLMPWLCRFEQAIRRQLLTKDEKRTHFLKFNVNGLLRGDMAARAAFYQTLWNMGVLSPNMILDLEDMNPIGPQGDKHLVQLNLTTLDKAGETPEPPTGLLPPPPVIDDQEARQRLIEYQTSIEGAAAAFDDVVERWKAMADGQSQAFDSALNSMTDAVKTAAGEGVELLKASIDQESRKLSELIEEVRKINDTIGSQVEDSERRNFAIKNATAMIFENALSRLLTKESKAVLFAAKDSKTFVDKLTEFYQKHERIIIEELDRPIFACNALGYSVEAAILAKTWRKDSQNMLQSVYDSATPADFESSVESTVDSWQSRPKEVTEEIFKG